MSCFTRARYVVLLFALFVVPARTLYASPLSANALFLAPSSVPTADYTVGRTFSTASESLHLTFTAGSLPDLPFGSVPTGVHILPLLNPNPSTTEGEYSPADLAGINSGNYSSYFFRQPGSDSSGDYWADLDSGQLAVHFNATGQYFLEIEYLLGGVSSSTDLYHVEVNDFFAGDGANDQAGVSRTIDGPTTDFNVVSTTVGEDNAAAENAATELTNRLGASRVARAGTLQQACDQIKAASEKAGKKLSVTLMGHGRPGSIRLGTERINSDEDGVMTATQFQECIDPYVSSIEFWSCDTAQGDEGTQFLKDFAESIGRATGFTVPVTVATTYWDIEAGGKKVSEVVPEPTSLLLLFTGLAAAAHRCRRRYWLESNR
jgi:hypothetical protein